MMLTIDSKGSNSKPLDSPAWDDVENAIRTLNGDSHTQVGLFVDNETFMQIGGGGENYVCSIRANGSLWVLHDPDESSDETKWVVAGQGDDHPLNECFNFDVIIEVAKWFWEHHLPTLKRHWNVF